MTLIIVHLVLEKFNKHFDRELRCCAQEWLVKVRKNVAWGHGLVWNQPERKLGRLIYGPVCLGVRYLYSPK